MLTGSMGTVSHVTVTAGFLKYVGTELKSHLEVQLQNTA